MAKYIRKRSLAAELRLLVERYAFKWHDDKTVEIETVKSLEHV